MSTFAWFAVAFYTVLVISALLSGLLLAIFRGKRDLLLLRAGCLVVLFMTLGILLWPAYHRGAVDEMLLETWLCRGQALVLHYVFVFLHVLAALIMLDNCYQSLDYRWWIFANGRLDRVTTLFYVALLLPLIPVVLVLFENSGGRQVIYPGVYFCYVRPFPLPSSLWYMACCAVGAYYSGRLFYKTLFRRARSVARFEQVTVFSRRYMVLLFARLLFYCLLAGGTSVPFVFQWRRLADAAPILLRASKLPRRERSPWTSSLDMCRWHFSAPRGMEDAEEYAELLCPTLMEHVPTFAGLFLFVLYGLGATAQQGYRAIWARVRAARESMRSRRESSFPLVGGHGADQVADYRTPSPIDEEEAGGTFSASSADDSSFSDGVVAVVPVAAPLSPPWLRDDFSSVSGVSFDAVAYDDAPEASAHNPNQHDTKSEDCDDADAECADSSSSHSSAPYGTPPFVSWEEPSDAEDM